MVNSVKFITSCCGLSIGNCPGCPGPTLLIKENQIHSKYEHPIYTKINAGTVTARDFDNLIFESMHMNKNKKHEF